MIELPMFFFVVHGEAEFMNKDSYALKAQTSMPF